MDRIQFTSKVHGTYSAWEGVVDLMAQKHLPASPMQLRAIAEEEAGHTFEDVTGVVAFLVILADFEEARMGLSNEVSR